MLRKLLPVFALGFSNSKPIDNAYANYYESYGAEAQTTDSPTIFQGSAKIMDQVSSIIQDTTTNLDSNSIETTNYQNYYENEYYQGPSSANNAEILQPLAEDSENQQFQESLDSLVNSVTDLLNSSDSEELEKAKFVSDEKQNLDENATLIQVNPSAESQEIDLANYEEQDSHHLNQAEHTDYYYDGYYDSETGEFIVPDPNENSNSLVSDLNDNDWLNDIRNYLEDEGSDDTDNNTKLEPTENKVAEPTLNSEESSFLDSTFESGINLLNKVQEITSKTLNQANYGEYYENYYESQEDDEESSSGEEDSASLSTKKTTEEVMSEMIDKMSQTMEELTEKADQSPINLESYSNYYSEYASDIDSNAISA